VGAPPAAVGILPIFFTSMCTSSTGRSRALAVAVFLLVPDPLPGLRAALDSRGTRGAWLRMRDTVRTGSKYARRLGVCTCGVSRVTDTVDQQATTANVRRALGSYVGRREDPR
jgi:hypothetical protein